MSAPTGHKEGTGQANGSNQTGSTFKRFTTKNILAAILLTVAYLAWVVGLMELRDDHVNMLIVLWLAYFAHPKSRNIFYAFVWVLIYWVVYDSLRVYPNYMVNPVHIVEPYHIEKALFGIMEGGQLLTPNEWFVVHQSEFLDVLSGAFYLSWVPVPFAFMIYLYFVNDKATMLQFSFVFFLANMIAIVVYYLYPAAPPWYVAEYGLEVENFNIPGSPAGLVGFDKYFGVEIFQNMYAKNGNVFAAIPSMHSAFPVLTTFYAIKKKMYKLAFFFFITIVGIWFAAVYTFHHYLIDVLLGGATAVLTLMIAEAMLKWPVTKRLYKKYLRLVKA